MAKWELSDGTVIDGSEVAGDSTVAETLRRLLLSLTRGLYVGVPVGPRPYSVKLDLTKPSIVDAWIRSKCGRGVTVTSGPEVEPVSAPVGPPTEPSKQLIY